MRYSKFFLVALGLFVSLSCSGGGGDTTGPPPPPPAPPETPTNVRVSAGQCGTKENTLSWTPSKGASGYHVYTDGDSLHPMTVTGTVWKHSGLAPKSTHTYQVDAFNAVGNSPKTYAVNGNAPNVCAPTVTLSANPPSVQAGTNTPADITVVATDADSCALMPQGIKVSGSFTVTPTPTQNSYTVSCSGPGGSGSATIAIAITAAPPIDSLVIEVWGVNSNFPFGSVSGLSVTVESGSWKTVVPITVQGNMGRVAIATPPGVEALMTDPVKTRVDATDTTQRIYDSPVSIVSRASAYASPLSFTLVPLSWRIPSGDYVGTVVPIQIGKAMLPAGDGLCFYCMAPTPDSLLIWPSYPVFVAFSDTIQDGRGSTLDFHVAADSIEFWRQVGGMEKRFGKNLYLPATATNATSLQNKVRVELDSTLPYAGVGGAGGSNNYFSMGIVIFQSGVTNSSGTPGVFSYQGAIEHELIHSMGIGHNCSWFTIMFTNCQLVTNIFRNSAIATPEDVAYFQVMDAVQRMRIAMGTRFGMDAALLGERDRGIVSTYSAPGPTASYLRVPTVNSRSGIHLVP